MLRDQLTCTNCGVRYASLDSFAKAGKWRGRQKYRSICHRCNSDRRRSWPLKRKQWTGRSEAERIAHNEYMRSWARKRRRTAEGRAVDRSHYERNKLAKNFAAVIRRALKGKKAGTSWTVLVGYDVHKLRTHLERQFSRRMSWANHGTYWEIDHIVPTSSFDHNDPEQFKACWALTNLRPLEKSSNQAKSNKRTHLI